jgi:hypothetical protein
LYFIGEIIATFLREKHFIVEAGSNGMFRVTLYRSDASKLSQIEIREGFNYQILIDFKNEIGYFVLDPKIRLIPGVNFDHYDDLSKLHFNARSTYKRYLYTELFREN